MSVSSLGSTLTIHGNEQIAVKSKAHTQTCGPGGSGFEFHLSFLMLLCSVMMQYVTDKESTRLFSLLSPCVCNKLSVSRIVGVFSSCVVRNVIVIA